MARDIQDKELSTKSPSKIRGGGAQAPGALNPESSNDTSKITNVDCRIDSPALTGTPSYPSGGFSQCTTQSPPKIRGGGAPAPAALNPESSNDTSMIEHVDCIINSPALTGTPAYPSGGFSQGTSPVQLPASPGSSPDNSTIPQVASQPKDHQVMNRPEMKLFRRELRSHGTSAEASLWKLLKGKQIAGLQFRRQYSVGDYILDFYCPTLKLAIELDGDYHYHMEMPDRDWQRDRMLLDRYGIKTLRFENKMVFTHTEAIRDAIIQELNAKSQDM